MSLRPNLKIAWCSTKAAKYACEKWHYSGTMPTNKSNRFGVWENDRFIGTVIFGLGASPSLGKPYGLGIFEVSELTRVALRDHASPVTRIVSICIKLFRKKNPNTQLILSFADPFHEHHGGIYQAGNWLYLGRSSSAKMWKLRDGTLVDPRRYNGHGHNRKKPVPSKAELIKVPGKHRYAYPLDAALRERLELQALPYPTRASEEGL